MGHNRSVIQKQVARNISATDGIHYQKLSRDNPGQGQVPRFHETGDAEHVGQRHFIVSESINLPEWTKGGYFYGTNLHGKYFTEAAHFFASAFWESA